MSIFDAQEIVITKELVRDPRISDNKISKKTKVPLKTVNRKRKKLEENGILNYFTYINHFKKGTKKFTARQMYTISLKQGITRQHFLNSMKASMFVTKHGMKHILESHLGETDGHLVLILFLESRVESDILEIFNADIVPGLKHKLGENCINKVKVTTLSQSLRMLHNYLPDTNIEGGKISPTWPNEKIFVD
ncbi:Lrp/AsnC family transcriptional regulator [Candidatus Woesearchaeota archaeon]|nr:Lrp/AsnC family transcriptional regulator [Candidatus Woesearchaeota archaeon]